MTEGMGGLESKAILSSEEVYERVYYADFAEKRAFYDMRSKFHKHSSDPTFYNRCEGD